MTANRQSGVSVSVVHDHLRYSFTELGSRSQDNSAPDFLSSQWLNSTLATIVVSEVKASVTAIGAVADGVIP